MPRVRKIERSPKDGINHYVVDASFLANWAIPPNKAREEPDRARVLACRAWWGEIERQLDDEKARVYVPDICIAETFKVLAKKYYVDRWFTSATDFNNARKRLHAFISMPPVTLRAARRVVRVHDISTTRDIIISVDRFYELFYKHGLAGVSVPDLMIVAAAKYLMDFFDVPKNRLHIITLDKKLRAGSRKIQELPTAYDPTEGADASTKVFI